MRCLVLATASALFLLACFAPLTAHADQPVADDPTEEDHAEVDDRDREDDVRPVRYASIELNPLALAVDRIGGQAQVAVMGPLTMIGGASRIDAGDLKGWAYEVGSRLYFGLEARRADGTRVAHVWVGASYLGDDLEQKNMRGERRGVALDLGLTTRIRGGLYVLAGIGVAHRVANLPIADDFERMDTTPRLLFSVGWGL